MAAILDFRSNDLATFDLQVTLPQVTRLILPTKFQVNWSFDPGEEVQNRLCILGFWFHTYCTGNSYFNTCSYRFFRRNVFRPQGYKTVFMLNSAEHEIFSANKYENVNNSWHFHINWQRNVHAQQCLARKNLQLLVILDLLAGQISCSVELSMKKVLYPRGQNNYNRERNQTGRMLSFLSC